MNKTASEKHRDKWKVFADLIFTKDKHQMRDILKKASFVFLIDQVNHKLYSDSQAVAKWVFRNQKNTPRRSKPHNK